MTEEIIKVETRPGNTKPKGRRSAPKAENRMVTKNTGEHLAYIFKERALGELEVLATYNGWWGGELGRVKLQQLVDAYKIDANDDEACYLAGISHEQLEYFQELHPGFYGIKHKCRQHLGLLAKKGFAKQVESGEASLTYLRLKRKEEGYNPRVELVTNTRDLIEKQSEEYRRLTERLREQTLEAHKNGQDIYVTEAEFEKHFGGNNPGDAHAGQDGDRHDAAPAIPESN